MHAMHAPRSSCRPHLPAKRCLLSTVHAPRPRRHGVADPEVRVVTREALPAATLAALETVGSSAQALGVLAGILAVHEGGHFAAARFLGIHVDKFSIGFGPKLCETEHDGVEYSLRALPLGGFVGFPDDDPYKPYRDDDPDLLTNRPVLDRVAVASAGIVANVACAFAVLFAQVCTVGTFDFSYSPGVRVPEVATASAADRAGMRAGDVVVAVEGKRLAASASAVKDLARRVSLQPGESTRLTLLRDGSNVEVTIVADDAYAPTVGVEGGMRQKPRLGVTLMPNSTAVNHKPSDPVEALAMASHSFNSLASSVTGSLRKLITAPEVAMDTLSGPVAVVAVGSEVARGGNGGMYQFAAAVNINLAVWNAMPLPALDGGYITLYLLELLRRKKLPKELERSVMSGGLLMFLGLGMVLVVRDTMALL